MNRLGRNLFSSLVVATLASAALPAYADVTVSGVVWPGTPYDPWGLDDTTLYVGGVSRPGYFSYDPGEVIVFNQGTMLTREAYLAAAEELGRVKVIGYGSTWTNLGRLEVGIGSGTFGELVIQTGAKVTTQSLWIGPRGLWGGGQVFVEGYDASLTSLTDTYIGRTEYSNRLDIKQGASFYSHNTYITHCGSCDGKVLLTGYASKWINTGEFSINGFGSVEVGYEANLQSSNAKISSGNSIGIGTVKVSGWGASWSNEGLLQLGTIGNSWGRGQIIVGDYGMVETQTTELRGYGGCAIVVDGFQAGWENSGDVLFDMVGENGPDLFIDGGGFVTIGGTLEILPPPVRPRAPWAGVHLRDGVMRVGAIDDIDGAFDFSDGDLYVGSFIGDLVNTKIGVLVVGDASPSTTIAGDYTQGRDATLDCALSGPSATPLLEVAGNLTLDGTLDVRPASANVSFQAGDVVQLFHQGGTLSGMFNAVAISVPLAPGLAWDTSDLYTTGAIRVVAAP